METADLIFEQPPSFGKRARKALIRILALGAVLLALFWLWRRPQASSTPAVEIKLSAAQYGDVHNVISASGKLQPFRVMDVKSKAAGTITQMAVEVGTMVRRGQLICRIDQQDVRPTAEAAEADVLAEAAGVRQAEVAVPLQTAMSRTQVAEASAALEQARARQRQAMVARSLQQNTNAIALKERRYNAQAANARYKQSLQVLGARPRQSGAAIAQASGGLQSAEATLSARRQVLARLQTATHPQQRRESQAAVEQEQAEAKTAKLNVEQEQAEVKTAKLNVEQEQAEVKTAKLNLDRVLLLRTQGVVSQSDLEIAENRLSIADSRLSVARERSAIADSRLSVAHERSAIADSRLNIARERLAVVPQQQAYEKGEQEELVSEASGALGQAKGRLAQAEANKVDVALSARDVEATRAARGQALALVENERANRRNVELKQGEVAAASAAVQQARAVLLRSQVGTYENQQRRDELAEAQARLQRAQAGARKAQLSLGDTAVFAPFDGTIIKTMADEGTVVQSGLVGEPSSISLVQLADTTRMYVNAQVDEADVRFMKVGKAVDIRLDAYPGVIKQGTVRKIFPLAEEVQNVTYLFVQVELNAGQVDATLKSNMNATCRFLAEEKRNVLCVPAEALKEEEGRITVQTLKDPAGAATLENLVSREVVVGIRGNEMVEIISGLSPGQQVVTRLRATSPSTSNDLKTSL